MAPFLFLSIVLLLSGLVSPGIREIGELDGRMDRARFQRTKEKNQLKKWERLWQGNLKRKWKRVLKAYHSPAYPPSREEMHLDILCPCYSPIIRPMIQLMNHSESNNLFVKLNISIPKDHFTQECIRCIPFQTF